MGNSLSGMKDTAPLVSIKCLVYNHEPYLRDCLEGFVRQQTTFPFEAIVHDDASSDASQAIIREYAEKYPHIIKPILQTENQYSKGKGVLSGILNAACRGKYVAYCEGDDYWTDPLKLQKQVDFLESHPDYSLCCTDFNIYTQETGEMVKAPASRCGNLTVADLVENNTIGTLTVLLRRSLMERYFSDFYPHLPSYPMGDYCMWIWMARQGSVYCLEDLTSVYRVQAESASHSRDAFRTYCFNRSALDIKLFFCREFRLAPWKYLRRRTKYIIRTCRENGWNKVMFRDLFFPNIYRTKAGRP